MTLSEQANEAKRTLLRLVPYGLYVVTARGKDGDVNGFTANWITQAGFDPPMVALAVAVDAYTLGLIRSSERYAINFIEDGNRDLLRRISRPRSKAPDKLDGVSLEDTARGVPYMTDALGYLELELRGELEYGADHLIVVGEVVDARVWREGAIQMMQAAGMKYSG